MTTSRLLAAAALVAGMAFAGAASAETVSFGDDRAAAFDSGSVTTTDMAPADTTVMARRGEPEQRGRANEAVHNHNRRGRGR